MQGVINKKNLSRFSLQERIYRYSLAGRDVTIRFHDLLVPMLLLMRLIVGWIFLWAGFDKLITGFDAAGFLVHSTSGPLQSWFVSLGESEAAVAIINPLVISSQIVMGFAILLGLGTRLALFWAGAQMFLFYISQFPPEHDLFMDYYLVYIVVFAILAAFGAGRILGADQYIERWRVLRAHCWLKYLLG